MTSTISTGNSYLDSLMKSPGTAPTTTAAGSQAPNQTIDQSGFLKLLTTQLQTQDPTEPTDNNQMVQQMATFSQVAGITQMNQTLSGMSGDIASTRFGSASSLIGRAALLASQVATQASNGAYAGQLTLPSDARDVTITLTNAAGQTVFSKDLGAQASGAVNWSWDGKDASGNLTSDGALTVNVTAIGTSGASLSATNATWNEVKAVKSPSSGTTGLITGLGTAAPSDVLQLS